MQEGIYLLEIFKNNTNDDISYMSHDLINNRIHHFNQIQNSIEKFKENDITEKADKDTFNKTITYNNTSFDYDTMKKEYSISYDEIEYITKETYMDTTSLIRYENYIYKVKIKNAGSFIFKYYDDSLDKAIKKLSIKSNIPINDLT